MRSRQASIEGLELSIRMLHVSSHIVPQLRMSKPRLSIRRLNTQTGAAYVVTHCFLSSGWASHNFLLQAECTKLHWMRCHTLCLS